MQSILNRQLRRILGVKEEGGFTPREIEELRTFLAENDAPPALLKIANGLPDLFARVDATYAQFERDLALRTRSLELSSRELIANNNELRGALASRESAIRELQALACRLQESIPEIAENESPATQGLNDQIALLASLIDRQEAQQAEMRALHADVANQKFALDQHAIVSITDLSGRITYANDRFCQISGYSRDELLGNTHQIINSGHHPEAFFECLWQTIGAGKVWHGEIRNRNKKGGIYWVNATIVPLNDASGTLCQYIAIRTDITERKQIEAKLADQLHFIEVLIESLPVALYLKDTEGRYLRFNRAFETLLGIERKDWVGRTVTELLPGNVGELMQAKDDELLRERGVQTYENRFQNWATGEERVGLYWKTCLTRPDGGTAGILGTIVDISDRKRSEDDLAKAKLAAEAANRSKSEFLANMSHEIRTPMNGILGMTELALDIAPDPTQRDYLKIVRSSAESLLVILNDILDFSKIEAGKLTIENVAFDLPETLAETLKSIATRAEKKGLTLVCDLHADLPGEVMGDPVRIRQILTNLCDNAIKFTAAGEVMVEASYRDNGAGSGMVSISVSDTGIGIPTEKQAQIFEAFSQADTSTTRQFGGTGLGLSISACLVKLMGGDIWVESEVGKGSRFHFTLGLDRSAGHSSNHPVPPPLTTWPGQVALVVDDHPVNRRSLRHWLEAWGFTVEEASNGADALKACLNREPPFSVVLLDAQMPVIDGFGFAEALHREGKERLQRTIMLSSGGGKGDVQRCRELGLGGYLTKPATPVELREALTRILAASDSSAETGDGFVTRGALALSNRRLSILVAEDHPVNQRLAQELFSKWGHDVTLANNGQEAVDLFFKGQWDIVFMDMQMPVMGGIEATIEIRSREPGGQRVPIVAMTANAMTADRQRCLNAGMDDHIPKPIKQRDVRQILEHFTARRGTVPVRHISDQEVSAALALADQEVLEIVGETICEQLPLDAESLSSSFTSGETESFVRAAHNLKSTFAMLGLDKLTETAAQMERAPEQAHWGDIESLTEAAEVVSRLLREAGI